MNEPAEPDGLDLTPDPSPPVGSGDAVVSIHGLLGEGADDTVVRLYLDADFTTFYEVPKDAVTRRERVLPADSPFGRASTVLQIQCGTLITVGHSTSRTIDHEFMAGDFTAPGSFRALTSFERPWALGGAVRYPTTVTVFDCRDCA